MRVVCLALLAVLLSGCWSRLELNDTAAVVGMGIDRTEDGLFQVVVGIAAGGGGGPMGQPGQGQTGQTERTIFQRNGRSLAEALQEAQRASSRRFLFDHTQVVIFGELLLEAGVNESLDWLLRDVGLRLTTPTLVVRKGDAAGLLEQRPTMGRLQSKGLRELMNRHGAVVVTLRQFFTAIVSGRGAALVPSVVLKPHPTREERGPELDPVWNGFAVLRNHRLAGYIEAPYTEGARWLLGDARGVVITVLCPGEPDRYFSARLTRSARRIDVRPANGGVRFETAVAGEYHIVEYHCAGDLFDARVVSRMQGALKAQVERNVTGAIRRTQEMRSDAFAFGRILRTRLPAVWDRVSENWGDVWAGATVAVYADVQMIQVELTTRRPD